MALTYLLSRQTAAPGKKIQWTPVNRHFKGGPKLFPGLSKTWILMSHYYHSLSVDATIMVSKN